MLFLDVNVKEQKHPPGEERYKYRKFHKNFHRQIIRYLNVIENSYGYKKYFFIHQMCITLLKNQNIMYKTQLYFRWSNFMWITYYKAIDIINFLTEEKRNPCQTKRFKYPPKLLGNVKKYKRKMENLVLNEYSKLPRILPLELKTYVISFLIASQQKVFSYKNKQA